MAFFHTNFLLQSHHHHDNDTANNPTSLPPIPSQEFHGVASLIGKRSSSAAFFPEMCDDQMNGQEDELSDDGSQVGEKKRRLNLEQVKTLEKNFELGNKLEPERKMQLARALGLQPRQIAIWFQNRRARWKTKQLEKDYEVLKRQFEAVKAENEALQAQNHKLHAEIMAVKNNGIGEAMTTTESINLNKETEGSISSNEDRMSENTSEIIKLDISTSNNNHRHITNTHHHHHLFPTSAAVMTTGAVPEKMEQPSAVKLEENQSHLCNMFVGMDDQSVAGYWPWLVDHQHFN